MDRLISGLIVVLLLAGENEWYLLDKWWNIFKIIHRQWTFFIHTLIISLSSEYCRIDHVSAKSWPKSAHFSISLIQGSHWNDHELIHSNQFQCATLPERTLVIYWEFMSSLFPWEFGVIKQALCLELLLLMSMLIR